MTPGNIVTIAGRRGAALVLKVHGGVVELEEFQTAHRRTVPVEKLTVRKRTYERGPKAGRLTRWGLAEARHQEVMHANRGLTRPRKRR